MRPPMRIVPRVGSSRPAIIRSVVLFPQPEGPTSTSSSPSPTVRSRSATAVTLPGNVLHKFSRVTSANVLRQLLNADAAERHGVLLVPEPHDMAFGPVYARMIAVVGGFVDLAQVGLGDHACR